MGFLVFLIQPLILEEYKHMAIVQSPQGGRFTTHTLYSSDSKYGERTPRKEVAPCKPAQGSLGENHEGLAFLIFWQDSELRGQRTVIAQTDFS